MHRLIAPSLSPPPAHPAHRWYTSQDKVKSGKYNLHKKKVKVFVRVSVEGLATIDVGTGAFVTKNKVHRIVGWYGDPKDREIFGIVVKGEGGSVGGEVNRFRCIVMKSKQALSALAGIKQLMAIIFSVPAAPLDPEEGGAGGSGPAVVDGVWGCPDCRYSNPDAEDECVMCGCAKPEEKSEDASPELAEAAAAATKEAGKVMAGVVRPISVAAGGDVELPPIEGFRTTHNPDDSPDYINLPRGIEAIELAGDSGTNDYVNLGAIVKESEAYLEANEMLALGNEALAAEMDRRMSMTPAQFAALPQAEQEATRAFSMHLSENNPFSRISLWEGDADSDGDGAGGGAPQAQSAGANNPFGVGGGPLGTNAEEVEDELGLDDELDELWGAKESSNPHNPF
jgi:hypothetical protein